MCGLICAHVRSLRTGLTSDSLIWAAALCGRLQYSRAPPECVRCLKELVQHTGMLCRVTAVSGVQVVCIHVRYADLHSIVLHAPFFNCVCHDSGHE